MSDAQTPSSQQPAAPRGYDREIARGALINMLGLSAKVLNPLVLLLIPWLFGPAVLGLYLLAKFLNDIATSAVTSGLVDGATLFASRRVEGAKTDASEQGALSQVMANALAISVGVSLVLVFLVLLGADLFVAALYPEHPELSPVLRLLAGGLPALAFSRIAIAGTKAHMRMEYDAGIMGFFQPFCFLVTAVAAKLMGGGLIGLMVAQLITYWLTAALALWALSRHFDLGKLFAALRALRFDRELLSFSIPQTINMTLNRYAARLDVIMLAAFGHSAKTLGFYGIASLIVNEMRQAKLVFASALAPVTARYHAADQREALQAVFNRVSRWTTSIIVPLSFLMVVLRDDLLRFVNRSYTGDTQFMALLLLTPLLSCAVGLAGNCITYTGHSRWTLFNGVVVAVLNTGFNAVFIPRYGLMGAAMGAALSSVLISALQLWELNMLERIRLRFADVYHPYLGLAAGAVVLAVLWDPVDLPSLGLRAASALGLALLSIGAMVAAGHPEIRPWIARKLRPNR